jgi:hypothetical protein
MSSFAEQFRSAQNAHLAASALEDQVRSQIAQAFDDWDSGRLSAVTVRHKLEGIVRNAYRTSAALAAAHAVRESGLPGWMPSASVFNTPYLKSLLEDVRRNLRDFKSSDQGDVERRRAVQRIQHSAGTAAQRGYTDALVASYTELQDMGFYVRKVWAANFDNNVPCEHCRALHGTEVDLQSNFPIPTKSDLKVYHNLKGPPRHPRCRCYLVILIVTLDNAFDTLDLDDPGEEPSYLTTAQVKSMPAKIFDAAVRVLRKIVSFVRGK